MRAMTLLTLAVLSLSLLLQLVPLELLLTYTVDLHVSAANIHAVLALHHLCPLRRHLYHCLTRKLPVLEDQAEAV